MKYQVCFHAKNKKKNVIFAPFAAKFFYREMVWNFIGVYSVYNKEHYMTAWRKEILILMLS